jgi:hypothetical protein
MEHFRLSPHAPVRPRSFGLVVLALLAACSPGGGQPPAAAKEPAAAPPAVSPAADPCAAITGRFRDALAGATGTCKADAECAYYNPVIAEAGCGGVTDAAAAKRLGAIEAEFHAAKCQWPHQCAAQVCAPKCVDGRCR